MAVYDLSRELDRARFRLRCNKLYEQRKTVELSEPQKRRTIDQNSLLHLWFAVIADDLGCSPEDAKRDIKRIYGGMEEYHSPITNRTEVREWRTSAMTCQQMTDFITWLEAWAQNELGIYLPRSGAEGYDDMIHHYYRT